MKNAVETASNIRRTGRWIAALVLLINLATAAVAAVWLSYNLDRHHQEAAAAASNLGRLMEVTVTTALRGVDLALGSMSAEIARCPTLGSAGCPALEKVLAERSKGLREAQAFFVISPAGQIIAGHSNSLKLGNVFADVSDRDYFRQLRGNPEDRLVISRPQLGKVTKRWALIVARPVLHGDGALAGIVIASIDLEYLQNVLQKANLGAHGALSLRDAEMGVILRVPEPKGIGTNIGSKNISPQLAAMLEKKLDAGVYRAVTPLDGVERTVSFTRASVYPLFVNVGLSAEDYLTPWRAERDIVLAVVAFLWLLTGSAGWLSWRQYQAQMGEMQRRLAAARELELAQRDIRELNIGLERRVEERTRELADANHQLRETLENLERTRDELLQREKLASLGAMVAGVAHELNTPIGNALLVASSLHEEAGVFAEQCNGRLTRGGLDAYVEKTVQGADMLLGNLRRAANLIASFKQLSIDQTSDQRRLFFLSDVCNEVVTALTPTLRKTTHRVELEIPDDLAIDSYPGAFGQALTNLITNAIDHAFDQREGGTVRIVGEALSPEEVRIVFSDDGRGMTPEVFRRVFDPFFTTKLGKGGSGIGMHIVYHLVTTTLGGKIVGDSGPHGTSWVLLLPIKAPVPPEGLDTPFVLERRT